MLLVPVFTGYPCLPVGGTSVGDATENVGQCPLLFIVPRPPILLPLHTKLSLTSLADRNHDF